MSYDFTGEIFFTSIKATVIEVVAFEATVSNNLTNCTPIENPT